LNTNEEEEEEGNEDKENEVNEDESEEEEEIQKNKKKRESDKIYVVPKTLAISYNDDSKKKNKEKERLEKKLKNNKIIKTLKEVIDEEPETEYSIGTEHGRGYDEASVLRREVEQYENENFKQAFLSKKDKKLLRQSERQLVNEVDDLETIDELLELDKYLNKKEDKKVTLIQYLDDVNEAKRDLDIDDEEEEEELNTKKRKFETKKTVKKVNHKK
jgi:hypothetical protein